MRLIRKESSPTRRNLVMAECVKKKAALEASKGQPFQFKAGDVVRVKKSTDENLASPGILMIVNESGVAKFNRARYSLGDDPGVNCTGLYYGAQSYTWEPEKLEYVCSANELVFKGEK